MELDARKVHEVMRAKGFTHLYHANTVQTACTYFQVGGLLSRGAVEHLGLLQTDQDSDEIDKEYGVWNDIFLDSADLHTIFPRQNYYGPVLFKFNIDILLSESLPPLMITKDNPVNWIDGQTKQERYFQSIKEFRNNYDQGAYQQMITLRDTFDVLPFEPYLEEIKIDDPGVKTGDLIYFKEAKTAIVEAIASSDFDYSNVKKRIRKCKECQNCYCHSNYLKQLGGAKLKKLFCLL